MDHVAARQVPTRLDAWKREQHPHHDVSTWAVPKTGGRVLRSAGRLYYRSTCHDCRAGFLYVREAPTNPVGSGTWPKRCAACQRAAEQLHNARAAIRMRELRKKRRPQAEKNRAIGEANRSSAYRRWLERKSQPGYYD